MKNSNFWHNVSTAAKPWTHLDFGSRGEGEDFSFAIISDRTGRPRSGVFEKGIEIVNRMRPDFVMSVGDYIESFNVEDQSRGFLLRQWRKVLPMIRKCVPPFFFLAGNHDYILPERDFPGTAERLEKIWKDFFGVTHYAFIYKKVLFLCLNSTESPDGGLGAEQIEEALAVLKEHADVRWTFVFLHCPSVWLEPGFKKLEEALYHRNYTVISGDLHQYTKYLRNGRKYFVLGTTGGGEVVPGKPMRGVSYGEFDHITWVSMCGKEPQFTQLALDGVYDENVVTTNKLTWLTAHYFRADKKLSLAEMKKLRGEGIAVENPKEEL